MSAVSLFELEFFISFYPEFHPPQPLPTQPLHPDSKRRFRSKLLLDAESKSVSPATTPRNGSSVARSSRRKRSVATSGTRVRSPIRPSVTSPAAATIFRLHSCPSSSNIPALPTVHHLRWPNPRTSERWTIASNFQMSLGGFQTLSSSPTSNTSQTPVTVRLSIRS